MATGLTKMHVGIVGASGQTGSSITTALLTEPSIFSIYALVRPASRSKPANQELERQGITLRDFDTTWTQERLTHELSDIDVLISAIGPEAQLDQIPIANAAKSAGVKRFLPCAYVSIVPPGGIQMLRDIKEQVYNHVKQIGLPYTIVDVGWWYQLSLPKLPSGRIDYALSMTSHNIPGDGTVPSALTDLADIGTYIARIITDARTLNKYVFIYNEILSKNQIYDLLEEMSGENLPRIYVSQEELEAEITAVDEELRTKTPADVTQLFRKSGAQYKISWGIRGDNTPEYAKYLGYLDGKELYPDVKYRPYKDYVSAVLGGLEQPVYKEIRAKLSAVAIQDVHR